MSPFPIIPCFYPIAIWGILTQFMGLRKINTIGIQQANKVMHMAACAYNLKKYLKYEQKLIKSMAQTAHPFICLLIHKIKQQTVLLQPSFCQLKI